MITNIDAALTLLRDSSVVVRDSDPTNDRWLKQNEQIDQMIAMAIKCLETVEPCATRLPAEARTSAALDVDAVGAVDYSDHHIDLLTNRLDILESQVNEILHEGRLRASEDIQELGERLESVENDLSDLKDDLPVDWEEATVEKIDEIVPNMVKGHMRDYLDRVRLSIVSPQEV